MVPLVWEVVIGVVQVDHVNRRLADELLAPHAFLWVGGEFAFPEAEGEGVNAFEAGFWVPGIDVTEGRVEFDGQWWCGRPWLGLEFRI